MVRGGRLEHRDACGERGVERQVPPEPPGNVRVGFDGDNTHARAGSCDSQGDQTDVRADVDEDTGSCGQLDAGIELGTSVVSVHEDVKPVRFARVDLDAHTTPPDFNATADPARRPRAKPDPQQMPLERSPPQGTETETQQAAHGAAEGCGKRVGLCGGRHGIRAKRPVPVYESTRAPLV